MKLGLALATLAFGLAGPASAERIFGLVIGIDDYAYVPKLHGAVNDAEDIADALSGLGAEVTLLLDRDATRAAILGAWDDVLAKADPGDRLIVSYAGHGSNEPEHTAGSEKDGRDENFLLAGFAPRGAAAGERIRDDEIADLLERSRHLDVILVADACHAGTVTRNLNPSLGYRYVTPSGLEADPLPPPPPPPGPAEGQDQVSLFLAAVNETEKVPEVMVDGEARGALSYAFASGLRGAADLDRDGTLTKGELETHVRRTVRVLSDGVQLPQSEPAGQENRSLLELPDLGAPVATPIPLRERPFADLPPLAAGALRQDGGAVISAVGQLVAEVRNPADIRAVEAKHRLVQTLNEIAEPPLDVRFDRGDRTYVEGDRFSIQVTGRQSRHLTLLNIGSDGTIAYLYPIRDYNDPEEAPANDRIDLPVAVAQPFGADHVIAVETDMYDNALRRDIQALDGKRDIATLWDLLRASDVRIGLFPFFTAKAEL